MMNSMRKCYVDASIFVNFYDTASPFHTQTQNCIQLLIEKCFQISFSSLVLDEYLHAIRRFSGYPQESMEIALHEGLKRIFFLPRIKLVHTPKNLQEHSQVIDFMRKYSLRPRDAYHLLIMKHNKIQHFATFDHDFEKVFEKGTLKKFPEAL